MATQIAIMVRHALILAACFCTPCAADEELIAQASPPIQEQLRKVAAALPTSEPLHLNEAAIQELAALNDPSATRLRSSSK
jgi:hypothetical protein